MVLKEGQIVEQGTHKELVELNGTYRELYDTKSKSLEFRKKRIWPNILSPEIGQ